MNGLVIPGKVPGWMPGILLLHAFHEKSLESFGLINVNEVIARVSTSAENHVHDTTTEHTPARSPTHSKVVRCSVAYWQ